MKKLIESNRRIIQLIFYCLITAPAFAVDGVLEINQTCAMQLGCFAGDSVGYPVTIDGNSGLSYRLTSDLVLPTVDTTGIVVNAPDVSIDLNGFSIVGQACFRARTDCTPTTGLGTGIIAFFLPGDSAGVSVRNGSITGMGRNGLFLGAQAHVTSLRVRWNRWNGIATGQASLIRDNVVFENKIAGIYTAGGSTVADNVIRRNSGNGITCGAGAVVRGNAVGINLGHGIATGAISNISANVVDYNNGSGITAGDYSSIIDNTAYANPANGIVAGTGSMVRGNTLNRNVPYGMSLGPKAAYRENVVVDATSSTGSVIGGYNMGSNFCNTNATCP